MPEDAHRGIVICGIGVVGIHDGDPRGLGLRQLRADEVERVGEQDDPISVLGNRLSDVGGDLLCYTVAVDQLGLDAERLAGGGKTCRRFGHERR